VNWARDFFIIPTEDRPVYFLTLCFMVQRIRTVSHTAPAPLFLTSLIAGKGSQDYLAFWQDRLGSEAGSRIKKVISFN
jgi:hypothetical protein